MKNIIVPTDFSANAENALTYACELNKKVKAKIMLLHTYHIPVPLGDSTIIPISDREMKEIAMDGLNRIKINYFKKYPDMQFGIETSLGLIGDEINSYGVKTESELIIMGTHGATGLREYLVGTNAAAVIENTTIPVLAVPGNATFKGFKKIVFAADYGNHNFGHMHKIIDLAKLFDSEIILLHISSGESEDNFEDREIDQFKERLVKESGYKKISYRLMEDKDVFHGINAYLEQFPPDVLAISMRDRSIFKKIFSRSLTKRMAYHSHVPVLAMHISNQPDHI